MWPNKRIQNSAMWRMTDPNADTGGERTRVVRTKDTRRMVRTQSQVKRTERRSK